MLIDTVSDRINFIAQTLHVVFSVFLSRLHVAVSVFPNK